MKISHKELVPKCPNCNSKILSPLFTKNDQKYQNSFTITRCNSCSLVFTNPILTTKKLFATYYNSYRSPITGKRFHFAIDFAMKFWRYLRAFRMAKLAGSNPILDIGCGQAIELQILNQYHYQVYGLEYSKNYAKSIEKNTGISIFYGNLGNVNIKEKKFGLITCLHSLEHIEEFQSYLIKFRKLLKKNGYLLISVPNFSSFESKLFGKYWFHLDIPRHLYHFSEQFLTLQLSKIGFRKIKSKHIAPEYDFFSLLQSILNYLYPSQQNLLYHILLNEERKSIKDYLLFILQIPVIFVITPITIIFITPILWLCNGNGTVEMVFQKI